MFFATDADEAEIMEVIDVFAALAHHVVIVNIVIAEVLSLETVAGPVIGR